MQSYPSSNRPRVKIASHHQPSAQSAEQKPQLV